MSKLSAAQKRAKDKLIDEFRSPYQLGESIATLRKLVLLGYAVENIPDDGGLRFVIEFKRAVNQQPAGQDKQLKFGDGDANR